MLSPLPVRQDRFQQAIKILVMLRMLNMTELVYDYVVYTVDWVFN